MTRASIVTSGSMQMMQFHHLTSVSSSLVCSVDIQGSNSPVLQYDDLLLAAAEPRIDVLAQFAQLLQADAGDARLQVEYPVVLGGEEKEWENGLIVVYW